MNLFRDLVKDVAGHAIWELVLIASGVAAYKLRKGRAASTLVRFMLSSLLLLIIFFFVAATIYLHRRQGFNNGVLFVIYFINSLAYLVIYASFNRNWLLPVCAKIKYFILRIGELAHPDYKPIPLEVETKKSISELIERLDDNYGLEIEHIQAEIVERGNEAVKPLIQALNHKRPKIRENAALTLGKLGDHRAIKPLIQKLDNQDNLSVIAAISLGRLDAAAIEPLTELLKSDNAEIASNALVALGHTNNKRAVEEIKNFLDEWTQKKKREGKSILDEALRLAADYNRTTLLTAISEEEKAKLEEFALRVEALRQQTEVYNIKSGGILSLCQDTLRLIPT